MVHAERHVCFERSHDQSLQVPRREPARHSLRGVTSGEQNPNLSPTSESSER